MTGCQAGGWHYSESTHKIVWGVPDAKYQLTPVALASELDRAIQSRGWTTALDRDSAVIEVTEPRTVREVNWKALVFVTRDDEGALVTRIDMSSDGRGVERDDELVDIVEHTCQTYFDGS